MKCQKIQARLVRAGVDAEVQQHLDRCSECASFNASLIAMRHALSSHHAAAEPDPGFSSRVIAALSAGGQVPEADSLDVLVWASRRLMPATAALALVLVAWLSVEPFPGAGSLLFSSPNEEAALAWLIAAEEMP